MAGMELMGYFFYLVFRPNMFLLSPPDSYRDMEKWWANYTLPGYRSSGIYSMCHYAS